MYLYPESYIAYDVLGSLLKKSTTLSVLLLLESELITSERSGEQTTIQSLLAYEIAIKPTALTLEILPGTRKSISPKISGSLTKSYPASNPASTASTLDEVE